jgi:transcriptional regulator with XRE-family HTH domain
VDSHAKHKKTAAFVASLLKKARENKKLSMNRLAEASGLSQQMVSYVERNMRNPSLDTLLRLSSALGINLGRVINKAISKTDQDS